MEKRERQDGITTEQAKGRTLRWQPLLPNLRRVNEAARRSGRTRFTALLHHVDVAALERAFRRQRRAASPGVDGVTVAEYEQALESNLQHLHDRVHSGQYWPQPVRRTYIPKGDGGHRPLGIPALEDKIVQGAVAEVLNAVYEADFLGFSYGFRPRRSPHTALATLEQALMTQRVNWVLDLDIRTFFDSVDPGWLMRMLRHRIADPRVLRLIERWLKAGVLESGRWEPGEVGVPQGSGISPILANVFLHYAFDAWIHQWRKRHARGQIVVVGATASLRGRPKTAAFAAAKAAQRSLCQSLARQCAPEGIHVGLLIIDGVIDAAGAAVDSPQAKKLRPEDIAEEAFHLVRQDRSAWTFELDLRPLQESW